MRIAAMRLMRLPARTPADLLRKADGPSIFAVVISFSLLCFVAFGFPSVRQGHTDFLSFYAGAKLAGSPHLYSLSHISEIQREFRAADEIKAFIRPPFYAVLLSPMGRLPFRTAELIWQSLLLAAAAAFITIWAPHPRSVLLCCWFVPLWVSLIIGQDMPLLLLCVALSALLLRRDRPFSAGVAMALCAAKFHLLLLLPVLIITKRLWRFAGGFAAGAGALAALSFAVQGWDWPKRYLDVLKVNESDLISRVYMANFAGLLGRLAHSEIWLTLSALVVIWGSWRVARRATIEFSLATALCGGLLVGFHGYIYDCAILLPLLLCLVDGVHPARRLTLTLLFGVSTITLSNPHTSVFGQLAVLLVFCLAVVEGTRRTQGRRLETPGARRIQYARD
jgi:hypothetical protein